MDLSRDRLILELEYITVVTNNSAFDREVKATEVSLNNPSFHLKMFTKAAILVD
jgi:hypothetical protein